MTDEPTAPSDFEPRGRPTPAVAKAMWEQTPNPTPQRVVDLLERRGWERVGWRTIHRWRQNGWKPLLKPGDTTEITKRRQAALKKLKGEDAAEAAKPPEPSAAAQRRKMLEGVIDETLRESAAAASTPASAPGDQQDRRTVLMSKTEAELREMEQKARLTFNIILLETATERANVLMLVPKDTAELVKAMAFSVGAARSTPAAPEAPIHPSDTAKVIEHQPASAISQKIAEFRRKQGSAA